MPEEGHSATSLASPSMSAFSQLEISTGYFLTSATCHKRSFDCRPTNSIGLFATSPSFSNTNPERFYIGANIGHGDLPQGGKGASALYPPNTCCSQWWESFRLRSSSYSGQVTLPTVQFNSAFRVPLRNLEHKARRRRMRNQPVFCISDARFGRGDAAAGVEHAALGADHAARLAHAAHE
jgi:hypothetical protein